MILARSLGQAWLLVPRGSPVVGKKAAAGWRAECCWRGCLDSQHTLAECLSMHVGNSGVRACLPSLVLPHIRPSTGGGLMA